MKLETWLDTFRAETITYETNEKNPKYQALHVKFVQAIRVNRLRRRLLYKQAVKQGLYVGKGFLYHLASRQI